MTTENTNLATVETTEVPAATEQVENKPTTPTPVDPVENSSMGFGLYFPVFKNLVHGLGGTAAKRVLISLIGGKLEPNSINLKNEKEKVVYNIGQKLLDDTLVLTIATLMEQEAKKLPQPPAEVPATEAVPVSEEKKDA